MEPVTDPRAERNDGTTAGRRSVSAPPSEEGSLMDRVEETRRKLEALEGDVRATIARERARRE